MVQAIFVFIAHKGPNDWENQQEPETKLSQQDRPLQGEANIYLIDFERINGKFDLCESWTKNVTADEILISYSNRWCWSLSVLIVAPVCFVILVHFYPTAFKLKVQ